MDTLAIKDINQPHPWLKTMLENDIWLKKMKTSLKNRKHRKKKDLKVGIHLDDEARVASELTHQATLNLLEKAIQDTQIKKGRALDAGCGDGRLVKYLFALKFEKVDMFDMDATGIAACEEMAKWSPVLDRVEQKEFKEWEWKHKYDAIFHTWSTGYLSDLELVQWLKEAKTFLNNKRRLVKDPECFIWILDNVGDGDLAYQHRGQWHRPLKLFESIFKKAEVKIF